MSPPMPLKVITDWTIRFYPHCCVWLLQACSVCATADLDSHAPIDHVEEDY